MQFYEKNLPPPPSYMATTLGPPPPPPLSVPSPHAPPPPPPPPMSSNQREDMLEGRILALTKENEKLKAELSTCVGPSRTMSHHSRTSSCTSNGFGIPLHAVARSPIQTDVGTPKTSEIRRADDDILNMSGGHLLPTSTEGANERAYVQLLAEYRRLVQVNEQLQLQQQQQQQQQSPQSSLRGSRANPPPPNGDFGPQAAAYWQSTSANGSATQVPATPTTAAEVAPAFHGSPVVSNSTPVSPKVGQFSSPTTKMQAKLAQPPTSQPIKKISKKQQEIQSETMTKEAYITHLERLLQQRDEQLAKFEGKGPEMLDSAVQATVWSSVARTQTGDDDDLDLVDSVKDSPIDKNLHVAAESKAVVLDTQSLLIQCAFTTLRPLSLQLFHEPLSSSLTTAPPPPPNQGNFAPASPQPRWAHRPYALTKKRSSGAMSSDSTGHGDAVAPMVELLAPMSSNMRWADEPCDLESSAPSKTPDRRNASWRDGSSKPSTAMAAAGGSSTTMQPAWRGGSRVSARQPSAVQTL